MYVIIALCWLAFPVASKLSAQELRSLNKYNHDAAHTFQMFQKLKGGGPGIGNEQSLLIISDWYLW